MVGALFPWGRPAGAAAAEAGGADGDALGLIERLTATQARCNEIEHMLSSHAAREEEELEKLNGRIFRIEGDIAEIKALLGGVQMSGRIIFAIVTGIVATIGVVYSVFTVLKSNITWKG